MYAAKVMQLPKTDENRDDDDEDFNEYDDILEMIRNEVHMMKKLKHPNIIQFIDAFYSKTKVIVITELSEVRLLFYRTLR